MGSIDFVAHLRADGARLAACADGHLDAMVPSCPGWNVADLVRHTGAVHRFFAEVVRTQAQAPPQMDMEQPTNGAVVPWFLDGLEQTAVILESADATQPIWTWSSTDDTVAWIQRRMAQETAVHRWDGEAAYGQTTAIDTALAVDGVDEFVDVFLPEADAGRDFGRGTIHLHCTDAEGEWLLALDGGHVQVERGHAKGDVAARGSASDLLLVLWRRISPDAVELFGDRGVLDAFLAAASIE